MNKEQALQIIKQILDIAIQRGVFSKLEDSQTALQALQTLAKDQNNLSVLHEQS